MRLRDFFDDKKVVTKILKMDENNKYGNAMTKPLPKGIIKKFSSMREFDWIVQGILDEDLFDIEFGHKNGNKNSYFLMKSTPQFWKKEDLVCKRKICIPTSRYNEAKR